MEPFDIEIDKDGFVVMVFGGGAHSFDGRKFNTFKSSLNCIYTSIHKDHFNNIWTKGTDGEFHKLALNKATPHKYNADFQPRIQRILESAWGDSSGQWYFAPRGKGYFSVEPDGGRGDEFYSKDLHGFFVTHLEDGTPLHFSVSNRDSLRQNIGLRLYYCHSKDSIIELAQGTASETHYESTLLTHLDGTMTLSMGSNDLFHFTPDSLISYKSFPYKVIKLFEDSRSQLWVGSTHGLYKIDIELLQEPICVLANDVAAVVAEDFDGGLWIKSQNLSFGYIPPARRQAVNKLCGSSSCLDVKSVATDFTRVYCLSNSVKTTNSIDVIENGQISVLKLPLKPTPSSKEYPFKLYYDHQSKLLWAIYSHKIASWNGQNWTVISIQPPGRISPNITDVTSWDKDTLVGVAGNCIFTVAHGQLLTPPKKLENPHNIKSIAVDSAKTIWMATGNGLWKYVDNEMVRPAQIPKEILDVACNRVLFAKGKIWIEIQGRGFFIVERDRIVPVLNKQGDQISCWSPMVGPKERIWALNNLIDDGEALCITDVGNDVLVESFGNVSEHQDAVPWQAIAVTSKHFFLGTRRGLMSEKIGNMSRSPLLTKSIIQEVHINHDKQPLLANYKLKHNQNSLLLKFSAADFQRKPLTFRSRLLGQDSNWLESEYSSIQYTNLSSGTFKFQIQSRVKNAPWGPSQFCTFIIDTPYYETWWFRSLMAIALLSIGGTIIFIWLNAKEKRNKLIISKLRAEQVALRVQMNPHFIFNALSSIQELVYNQSKTIALENISLFARLIRQILELSRFDLIQLDKEINLLSDYLEIESMRFEKRFEFRIEVAKGLEPRNCLIPPMLLQPLVENSIKHGLLNSEVKNGQVYIRFQLADKQLECIIEDNGIGLQKSKVFNNQDENNHRSFALESIKRRIDLINLERNEKINIKIDSSQDELLHGTRVTLLIQQ